MDYAGGAPEAQHLCVLVHGLWGNPNHMTNIAKSLRVSHPTEELYILLAKRNAGSFTYDGIEKGSERLCAEIEDEMRGKKYTRLSIVGYSFGGLVARYAVGLLQAKGILDKIECMNFVTFATPHLGVRSPLKGLHNYVWNMVGSWTLSMSGRQLFIIDSFRDTAKPLLSVLANPDSIFMIGLRKFKRHTLYCNIVNDRAAVYYTTGIAKTDPYADANSLNVNYLEGFGEVILDPERPIDAKPKDKAPSSFREPFVRRLKRIPLVLTLAVLIPVGIVGFICNSAYQTARSASRIKLHEKGEGGLNVDQYLVPLFIKERLSEAEFGTLESSRGQENLRAEHESGEAMDGPQRRRVTGGRRRSVLDQPTLALVPVQFEMIESLDSLKWRKYPVWIRKVRHSHAAIIVRMDKESFSEGRVVMRHFSEVEFLP